MPLGEVGGVEYDPNDDMAKMMLPLRALLGITSSTAPLDDEQLQKLTMSTYVAIADVTPWLVRRSR